jgi:hypothetical protein
MLLTLAEAIEAGHHIAMAARKRVLRLPTFGTGSEEEIKERLNKREIDMGIAAGLVLTALALLVSLGFNYLPIHIANEERAQHTRDKAEAKAEGERKERTPPEFFNMGGAPRPIAITGSHG